MESSDHDGSRVQSSVVRRRDMSLCTSDGFDGWQSPGPRGDNIGRRARVPHLPTITFVSRRRVLYFVMGGPVDSVRDGVLAEE